MRILFLCIMLALLLPVFAQSSLSRMTDEEAAAWLGGTIVRPVRLLKPDGTPAVGAQIIARTFKGNGFLPGDYPAMTAEKSYTTDANGKANIDLPVSAGASYRPFSSYALVFAPGCCVTVLPLSEFAGEITLLPEKMMEVNVAMPDGRLIAGASVALVSVVDIFHFNNPAVGVSTPQFIFKTAADGRARIPLVNTGRNPTVATTTMNTIAWANAKMPAAMGGGSKAFVAYPASFGISEKRTEVTLNLKEAITIRGSVTTADGKPLAGASVGHASVPLAPVTTDAAGKYALYGVPPASPDKQQRLKITCPDYALATAPIPTTGEVAAVALQPMITVKGRVVDAATGTPLQTVFNLQVSFYTAPEHTNATLSALYLRSAADGTFTIRIPSSLCGIVASTPGFNGTKYMQNRVFTDGETIELKVEKGVGGVRR